jgi:hypothetical protein
MIPHALPWIVRAICLLWRIRTGEPDLYIGGRDNPYLLRWHLLRKDSRPLNIYLHHMVRDDDDRALHDHPWWFVSVILAGGYVEVVPRWPDTWLILTRSIWFDTPPAQGSPYWRWQLQQLNEVERRPGAVLLRRALSIHRLVLRRPRHLGGESWSLVITGRPRRRWGFYCESGWRDAQEFARITDTESVRSRGCD